MRRPAQTRHPPGTGVYTLSHAFVGEGAGLSERVRAHACRGARCRPREHRRSADGSTGAGSRVVDGSLPRRAVPSPTGVRRNLADEARKTRRAAPGHSASPFVSPRPPRDSLLSLLTRDRTVQRTTPPARCGQPFTDRDRVDDLHEQTSCRAAGYPLSKNADPVPSPAAASLPRTACILRVPSGPRPAVTIASTQQFQPPPVVLGEVGELREPGGGAHRRR